MIEIWTELTKFKATNQKLADLVRIITKNGCFSDLEILEIHRQINVPIQTNNRVREKQKHLEQNMGTERSQQKKPNG